MWSKDGKEIFYLALDSRLMAVPVTLTASRADFGAVRRYFRSVPVAPARFTT